jgi:hypothetical protein
MTDQMKIDHAGQPRLCDACHQDLLNRISDADAQHCVYCKHTGTQAIISVKDGRIIFWTISGPATVEQAAQLAGRMQEDEFKNVATHPSLN